MSLKKITIYYPSGRIHAEFNVDTNGTKQGAFEFFYDSHGSPLMKRGFYLNGQYHGPLKTWHKNGNKMLLTHFNAGQYFLYTCSWDESGNIKDYTRY